MNKIKLPRWPHPTNFITRALNGLPPGIIIKICKPETSEGKSNIRRYILSNKGKDKDVK